MADTICGLTLPTQHHAGDVDGLRVGDPQAVTELGHLAQARHQVADLRAAAVHHDGLHADGVHQHDVLGEQAERVGIDGGVGQRVAAVLDDDDLAGEATDVRQAFDQHRRLLGGRGAHDGHDVPLFSSM